MTGSFMKKERFNLSFSSFDYDENIIEDIAEFFCYEDLKAELASVINAQEVNVHDLLNNKSTSVYCIETREYYFVSSVGAGAGWGQYPKDGFSEREAIEDQSFLGWER